MRLAGGLDGDGQAASSCDDVDPVRGGLGAALVLRATPTSWRLVSKKKGGENSSFCCCDKKSPRDSRNDEVSSCMLSHFSGV